METAEQNLPLKFERSQVDDPMCVMSPSADVICAVQIKKSGSNKGRERELIYRAYEERDFHFVIFYR